MPGKKKGKGKKAKKTENRIDTLNEVDKTFYELQITDLNRKLARLKLTSQEIENRNQILENKLENLDEDRADVISYLKRTLTVKQNESMELQDRVTALQETKDSEGKEFEEKIEELETENRTMKEQLTSEIKLLTGKLNALEEFRMQRDELMEKFEAQERIIQEHEIKEKKTMYEIEKKFILSKKNIASEMEKQLFKLANNFEKANEIRMAATTQRCIRENIALNAELNKMILTLDNLNDQVEDYKSKNVELKLDAELYQAERNKTLNELHVVRTHLDQVTKDFQARVKILRTYEGAMKKSQKAYEEMKHALARETALAAKVRILEQNLHATRCKEIELKQLVQRQSKLVKYFHDINREAVIAIEDCLKISLHPRLDEAGKQYRRELLLQNLLTILTQRRINTHAVLSLETIDSIDAKYQRGDLGFLPKEVSRAKEKEFLLLNAAVQVTPRYEEGTHLLSPVQSHAPSITQSELSVMTADSFNFQACSLLDVQDNNSHSLYNSVIFPGKFISEMHIEEMLSTSQFSDSVMSRTSKELDGDKKSEENVEEEQEGEMEEEECEYQGEEEVEVVEEKPVEEDEENTVFGNDDDDDDEETETSDTSPND